MLFATLKAYLADAVVDTTWEGVTIVPGPNVPEIPGRFVLLTPFSGDGLSVEGLFDARGWQVRAVGEQESYEDAEGLAFALDKVLRAENSKTVGGVRVASINRQGGSPYPLIVDDADRTHFVCSYNIDVEST